MSRACRECSQELPEGGLFCPRCGVRVEQSPTDAGDSAASGQTNARLPRVVVPPEDFDLGGGDQLGGDQLGDDQDGDGRAGADQKPYDPDDPDVQSDAQHDDDWLPPGYGDGPRFPLYADEVADYPGATTYPAASYAPGTTSTLAHGTTSTDAFEGPATYDTSASGLGLLPPVPAEEAPAERHRTPRALPLLIVFLAVLLVAAAIGGAFLLGSGGESEETSAASSEATSGEASSSASVEVTDEDPEVTVSDPVSLDDYATASASSTGPDGTSLSGETVSYDAANLLDGDTGTAWRVEGDGTGETLTFTFSEEVAITSLGIVNGYAKVDEYDGETVDWYERNRVVTQVTWTFDDGETLEQDFVRDSDLQSTEIPAKLTSSITLRIDAVSGHNGADRTPISEVDFEGALASDVE